MSRPKKAPGEGREIMLTVRVRPAGLAALDALCERLDITRSQALREGLRMYLEAHDGLDGLGLVGGNRPRRPYPKAQTRRSEW